MWRGRRASENGKVIEIAGDDQHEVGAANELKGLAATQKGVYAGDGAEGETVELRKVRGISSGVDDGNPCELFVVAANSDLLIRTFEVPGTSLEPVGGVRGRAVRQVSESGRMC